MARAETILPPHVILTPESIYAIQGDIYALEPLSGAIQHHYPIEGSPRLALTHEVFYMEASIVSITVLPTKVTAHVRRRRCPGLSGGR